MSPRRRRDFIEEPARPLKSALYIRVSTDMQADKDSLPMQRRDLIAYSEVVLGIPDYEIFEDAGYSGKNMDRPAFQSMMERMRKGEFTHLLVWKIDRISRNLLDFSQMYEELRKLNVTFISKNEQFDTSNAMGEAMLKIILVFAELERKMTSERVAATMISRATQGEWNGGPIPYGYAFDKNTKQFSIIEDEKAVIRLMYDLYMSGNSLSKIETELYNRGIRTRSGKVFRSALIYKYLTREFYLGSYRYNKHDESDGFTIRPRDEWVVVENHHPAIFTTEEHETILNLLSSGKKIVPSGNGGAGIFGGFCICGQCGARVSICAIKKKKNGYDKRYRCLNYIKAPSCKNPSVSSDYLGEFLLNYVLNFLCCYFQISDISTTQELESRLLRGLTFSKVESISEDGLSDCLQVLRGLPMLTTEPDTHETLSASALRQEIDKQRRALARLQKSFIYYGVSEKDYITQKLEIEKKLREATEKLGFHNSEAVELLTNEEFLARTKNILLANGMEGKEYVYFPDALKTIPEDVFKQYFESIIKCVEILGGKVSCIIFRNGMVHRFTYK